MGNIKILKVVKMRKQKKTDIDIKICLKTLENLIKNDKIKFSFYNNSILNLDLLQIYYNKHNDRIEMEFRDIMEEHMTELRKIMNKE